MRTNLFILAIIPMFFIACKSGDKNTGATSDSTQTVATPIETASGTMTAKAFDINAIPVSDKELDSFPYITLPEGYERENQNTRMVEYDHFYVWAGDHFERTKGKIFAGYIRSKGDKTFSAAEVQEGLEKSIRDAGGARVFSGRIPKDSLDMLGQQGNFTVAYVTALGDIYNNPAHVYLIRRADKNIWIHSCLSMYDGGWAVIETKP